LKTLAAFRRQETLGALQEMLADVRLRQVVMQNHRGVIIEKNVVILGYEKTRFHVANARIANGSILSFGDDVTGYGEITIGDGTWIGQYNNLRASEEANISIGRQCLISQFCTLISSNHNIVKGKPIMEQGLDEKRKGVQLGNDIWLGAGCAVMPGACIGDGVVVGANSVVTKNIPPAEIWAGVPARKIGERE